VRKKKIIKEKIKRRDVRERKKGDGESER